MVSLRNKPITYERSYLFIYLFRSRISQGIIPKGYVPKQNEAISQDSNTKEYTTIHEIVDGLIYVELNGSVGSLLRSRGGLTKNNREGSPNGVD